MEPDVTDAYHELSAYTLMHGDPAFIHQHVVDAWAAQTAAPTDKPIRLAFALAGLHLHVEHGVTGREVQRAHMRMAKLPKRFPPFVLPASRGTITALDVMRAPAGDERDAAIDAWCASVWAAYAEARPVVIRMLEEMRELLPNARASSSPRRTS